MPTDILPERLKLAIRELTPQQSDRLRKIAEQRGISGGGINGWIASAAGIPTQSMLADMCGGRTPGYRYHEELAGLLQVELSWLRGDDAAAPDWQLPPLDAWERYAMRIDGLWHRAHGPHQRVEESASEVRVAPADEQRIARLLSLPLGHADLGRLAGGRYASCEFAVVVRFAEHLGLAAPSHPEHLRRGQEIAVIVERRVEQALKLARRRYARFLLPPRLFQAARLGLVGLKARQAYLGKSQQTIDDCIEVLWRQQYLRRGEPKRSPPEQFMRETERSAWTPLPRILARYPDDADFTQAYDSSSG